MGNGDLILVMRRANKGILMTESVRIVQGKKFKRDIMWLRTRPQELFKSSDGFV